jgi:hypothetical protein
MRYSIVLLVLAAIYQLVITVGGGMFFLCTLRGAADIIDEYNVIPKWLDQLSWRSRELFA